MNFTPAKLALEDGTVLRGRSVGAAGERLGEVVFNTSLTGYQEVFTDASYNGQMVVMTNPLIGNYGVNAEDEESRQPFVRGVIVREISRTASNFRSREELPHYLARHGVVGITGIDTRAVTKLLRVSGALKGVLSTTDLDDQSLVRKARDWPGLEGRDMVKEVTCEEPQLWTRGFSSSFAQCYLQNRTGQDRAREKVGKGLRIAALDYGVKHNILRILRELGFEVHRLPADSTPENVRAVQPDGVFLSNGPGDPEGVPYATETIRALLGDYPIFGICLGHQLLAHALGGRTYKLQFGHHGGNHPVMNLRTGKVEISVQNHCYAVDLDSLDSTEVEPYFRNLNDGSLEGFYHRGLPLFAVQFHPESAPGPNDLTFLFDEFAALIRNGAPLKIE